MDFQIGVRLFCFCLDKLFSFFSVESMTKFLFHLIFFNYPDNDLGITFGVYFVYIFSSAH